jgi:hypothetical protein
VAKPSTSMENGVARMTGRTSWTKVLRAGHALKTSSDRCRCQVRNRSAKAQSGRKETVM